MVTIYLTGQCMSFLSSHLIQIPFFISSFIWSIDLGPGLLLFITILTAYFVFLLFSIFSEYSNPSIYIFIQWCSTWISWRDRIRNDTTEQRIGIKINNREDISTTKQLLYIMKILITGMSDTDVHWLL